MCHLEGPRVRAGGVVSTKSALEANDAQEDLVVSCSKLGEVFRSEGPRHTPVQQGLDYLGLKLYKTFRLGGAIIRCPRHFLEETPRIWHRCSMNPF